MTREKVYFYFYYNSMDYFSVCHQCHLNYSDNLDAALVAEISVKFNKLALCTLATVLGLLNMEPFWEGF